LISGVASPRDHLIEITWAASGTQVDVVATMRIQISIGEIIEAMYDELLETYGDKELAMIAAQSLGDDLLDEARRSAARMLRSGDGDVSGAVRRDRARAASAARQAAA
jgi:hypothetical protein